MNLAKFGLAALFFFSSLQAGACKDNDRDWTEERILYDNFSDGGASYNTKWSAPFYGLAGETFFQDGGTLIISFPKGKLKISSREFQWSSDTLFYDHIKYLGTSNQVFPIPQKGSIEFSANIKARTFKTVPDLKMIAHKTSTGETVEYLLNRGQQAAVTFHMLNFHETGMLFDWFVYGNQAFALYERLFDAPLFPANIETAFTQVVKIVKLDNPGTHKFAFRYTRNVDGDNDSIEYLIDDEVIAVIKNVGIPLDKQKKWKNHKVVYPSQGPGERVKNEMSSMIIGHGLFSLVDKFPFQQEDLDGTSVTIPLRGPGPDECSKHPKVSSRIWGQGAEGTFDNFQVIIRTKN